jgi:glycosyltransferase involved in cell wall biosynthesis
VLITNFHPTGGGGHVPYIQALTDIPAFAEDIVVGVSAPKGSRIYQYLSESSQPFLFPNDYPAKIQKELPDILKSMRNFRKIVAEFKPHIVHTNGAADLFIATWSYPISGPPYKIVRTHHAIRTLPKSPYHRWLYSKRAESNIYVSRSSFELSTDKGLVPSNPVVIANGVDLEQFRPVPRDAALAREYGIDDHCLCFGSCAGTGSYKRIDTIIDAAIELKKQGSYNFKILVLGQESSGLALQKMAHEKGLKEFIYCGYHKDIEPYVSLFDAGFILSDSIETISFAAREMMAMGKPLISSSFSGLKENVLHGINGFLVRPGNVADTASAMKQYLEMSKETLQQFSLQARAYAMDNFDISTQQKDHASLYRSLAVTAVKR